jgi:hypothetical protein
MTPKERRGKTMSHAICRHVNSANGWLWLPGQLCVGLPEIIDNERAVDSVVGQKGHHSIYFPLREGRARNGAVGDVDHRCVTP